MAEKRREEEEDGDRRKKNPVLILESLKLRHKRTAEKIW